MSPIKGVTDRKASFPLIGKLRKGAPKPESGQRPGADLKYFRFESDEPGVKELFESVYTAEPRDIRVFFNHQFRMYGIYKKDTVYFDPSDKTIIQYKGRRVVLIGGEKNGKSFDDFSVGLSYIEGKEGTFRSREKKCGDVCFWA